MTQGEPDMIAMDMTDKITLITGAGGGIGGGIADVFAKAGATVYVADLDVNDAKAKADQIRQEGGLACAAALDITSKTDIQTLVGRIVEEKGSIDHLINCAGISINKPYMESTDDEFRKILDVNLIGMWYGDAVKWYGDAVNLKWYGDAVNL